MGGPCPSQIGTSHLAPQWEKERHECRRSNVFSFQTTEQPSPSSITSSYPSDLGHLQSLLKTFPNPIARLPRPSHKTETPYTGCDSYHHETHLSPTSPRCRRVSSCPICVLEARTYLNPSILQSCFVAMLTNSAQRPAC